ncbi:PREDICTED: uncharacterized protein At4g22758-like [Ipomoea nil]|uniref:uncharacterized protein At4g22758-like n=1 Tax=Ipomoea nil TaxID=35883 RepID=UPI000900CBF2|nr:PREDICTED: uncharacterized protein At4g22758-like [Ipomoea nil]
MTSSFPAKHRMPAAMHGGVRLPPRLADARTNSELVSEFVNIPTRKPVTTASGGGECEQKLTKLLLNVNIQNSLGPVHVVMSPENSVADLIRAAVEIYAKEKRRPLLASTDPARYELHYSQFSLESLKPEEFLKNLKSRKFFLCLNSNYTMM